MTGVSRLCLVVSALLCVGAVVSYRRVARKMSSWRRATGTVIEIKSEERPDTDDDLQLMSASVVRFAVQGRADVTFQDPVWSTRAIHVVGQQVQVLYDPTSPSSATLAGWRSYVAPMSFALATVVLLLISLAES